MSDQKREVPPPPPNPARLEGQIPAKDGGSGENNRRPAGHHEGRPDLAQKAQAASGEFKAPVGPMDSYRQDNDTYQDIWDKGKSTPAQTKPHDAKTQESKPQEQKPQKSAKEATEGKSAKDTPKPKTEGKPPADFPKPDTKPSTDQARSKSQETSRPVESEAKPTTDRAGDKHVSRDPNRGHLSKVGEGAQPRDGGQSSIDGAKSKSDLGVESANRPRTDRHEGRPNLGRTDQTTPGHQFRSPLGPMDQAPQDRGTKHEIWDEGRGPETGRPPDADQPSSDDARLKKDVGAADAHRPETDRHEGRPNLGRTDQLQPGHEFKSPLGPMDQSPQDRGTKHEIWDEGKPSPPGAKPHDTQQEVPAREDHTKPQQAKRHETSKARDGGLAPDAASPTLEGKAVGDFFNKSQEHRTEPLGDRASDKAKPAPSKAETDQASAPSTVPKDLAAARKQIMAWVAAEDKPKKERERLLDVNPDDREHNFRVAYAVNYALLKAGAKQEKDYTAAEFAKISEKALWILTKDLRQADEKLGTSESLFLRDAQRYLYGSLGEKWLQKHIVDKYHIPKELAPYLSGEVIDKGYEKGVKRALMGANALVEEITGKNPGYGRGKAGMPHSRPGAEHWYNLGMTRFRAVNPEDDTKVKGSPFITTPPSSFRLPVTGVLGRNEAESIYLPGERIDKKTGKFHLDRGPRW